MAVLLHLELQTNKLPMSTKDKKEKSQVEEVSEKTSSPETSSDAQVVNEDEKTTEEKLSEDLQNEKDKYLRLFAEFENYKKGLPESE